MAIILLFFLFLTFSLIKSQCLLYNSDTCMICNYDYYLQSYLNYTYNPLGKECLPKKTSHFSRKIVVTTNTCNKAYLDAFDACYESLIEGFEIENDLILPYLTSSLDFYLTEGKHYILRKNLKFQDKELFRRNLVEISISPLKNINDVPIVSIKTNDFFIFISKNLSINNIDFEGFDIEAQTENNANGCYNSKSNQCCSEADHWNASDSNPCRLYLRIFNNDLNDKYYGLFNLEELILDEKSANMYKPNINITNCSFYNFFPVHENKGWSILFSFSPSNGKIFIRQTLFKDLFFPKGLIYHSNIKFDLYTSILQGKKYIFEQLIEFNGCYIVNYNKFSILNSGLSIFQIEGFCGNISLINNFFKEITSSNYLLSVQNGETNTLISNTFFDFLFQVSFFFMKSINILILDGLYLKNLSNLNPFLTLININETSMRNIGFENIKIYGSDAIIFLKSIINWANSIFLGIYCENLFNLKNTLQKINNGTFIHNFCEKNLFNILSINDSSIFNSYFFNNTGKNTLFFTSYVNFLIIQNTLLTGSEFFCVFYLNAANLNENRRFFIKNNSFFNIWSTDHMCNITKNIELVIESNIISSKLLGVFSLPNLIFILSKSLVRYNNLSSTYMIKMQTGIGVFSNCIITNNYFMIPDEFSSFLSFGNENILYMNACYFDDNGVIEEKKFYRANSHNTFITFFEQGSSSIVDCYFVVGRLIDLASGFIVGIPFSGTIAVINDTFLVYDTNPLFRYKAIILDWFKKATFINNSFKNLLCNNMDFFHSHGNLLLTASGIFYDKNDLLIYMENNVFLNCNCLYGAGLTIKGINNVVLINNSFFNSSANFYSGNLLIIGGENIFIEDINVSNSIADEGAGLFLKNIIKVEVNKLSILNALSRRNGVIYLENINNIVLKNSNASNLLSFMNGGFIFLLHSVLTIQNSAINSTEAFIDGGMIFIKEKSSLNLMNCKLTKSFAIKGGSIAIDTADYIEIFNCSFEEISASDKGGIIFVGDAKNFVVIDTILNKSTSGGYGIFFLGINDENSVVQISNITFLKTFSLKKGSCFYYFSTSKLFVEYLNIIENGVSPIFVHCFFPVKLHFDSLLFFNSSSFENYLMIIDDEVDLILKNCIFAKNYARIILFLKSSTIYLNGIYFQGNIANFSIYIEKSNGIISNLEFNEEKLLIIGGIFSIFSNLNFKNINLNQNIALKDGFFEIIEGALTVTNSIFINNFGQSFKVKQSSILIKECFFENNTNHNMESPNEIMIENTQSTLYSFEIYDSSFKINTGFILRALGNIEIVIYDSNFTSFEENKCFSLYIQNAYHLKIIKSIFSEFNQGNIFIYTSSSILTHINFYACYFVNISGNLGSALYFYGNCIIYIESSIFQNNHAIKNWLKNDSNNLHGIAPCLFFKNLSNIISKIEIKLSVFRNNSANNMVSTVFSQVPVISTNNLFSHNSDPYNFSNNFFSFPLILENQKLKEKKLINITSGVPFNIEFILLDYFNQRLNFDNKTILILKNSLNKNTVSVSIENGQSQALNGKFNFNNLILKAKPNSTFQISIIGRFSGMSNNLQNEINAINIEKNLFFYSRICFVGEIILNFKSCYFCPKDSYSLIDPMVYQSKYQKCYDCPKNSYCYGGKYIAPLEGYYRKSNTSTNVIGCLNKYVCLGSPPFELKDNFIENFNETTLKGVCKKGNYGELCFYCDQGYGKYAKNEECQPCDSSSSLVYVRLISYIMIINIYIILNCYLAENFKKNSAGLKNSLGTFFKILVNHSQHIMIILFNNNRNFPLLSIKEIFDINDYIAFTNENIITNDCILQHIYDEPTTNFLSKQIFYSVLPLIFTVISFLIWLGLHSGLSKFNFFHYMSEKIPRTLKAIRSKVLFFLLISSFIFYPIIVKSCFSLLDCMVIDFNEGKTFLKESPYLECWVNPHIKYIFFIGLPSLIIWGVLFPTFLFWILKKNLEVVNLGRKMEIVTRDVLIKQTIHFKSGSKNRVESKKVDLKSSLYFSKILEDSQYYIFFFKDYKAKYYYWECLIFIRKFFISFFVSMKETIPQEINMFFMLFLIFLSLFLTTIFSPYSLKNTNNAECLSLFVSWINILSAFIFEIDNNQNFLELISIICLLFNFLFFFYVLGNIVLAILKIYKKLQKKKSLKKKKKTCFDQKIKIFDI